MRLRSSTLESLILGEDKVSDIATASMEGSLTSPSTPTDHNVSDFVLSDMEVMNLAPSVSADLKVSNAVQTLKAPIDTVPPLSAEDDSSNIAPATMEWGVFFWEPPSYIKPKDPNRTQTASSFCNFNFEWASIPHDRDSSIDDEEFSLFDSDSESEFDYVEFDAAPDNMKATTLGLLLLAWISSFSNRQNLLQPKSPMQLRNLRCFPTSHQKSGTWSGSGHFLALE